MQRRPASAIFLNLRVVRRSAKKQNRGNHSHSLQHLFLRLIHRKQPLFHSPPNQIAHVFRMVQLPFSLMFEHASFLTRSFPCTLPAKTRLSWLNPAGLAPAIWTSPE